MFSKQIPHTCAFHSNRVEMVAETVQYRVEEIRMDQVSTRAGGGSDLRTTGRDAAEYVLSSGCGTVQKV